MEQKNDKLGYEELLRIAVSYAKEGRNKEAGLVIQYMIERWPERILPPDDSDLDVLDSELDVSPPTP